MTTKKSFFTFILFFLLGFSSLASKVLLTVSNAKAGMVIKQVNSNYMFDKEPFQEIKLDEQGKAIIELDVTIEKFVYLDIGEGNVVQLLVKPNEEYVINYDSNDYYSVEILGKDAKINMYLESIKILVPNFKFNDKILINWDEDEFFSAIPKLEAVVFSEFYKILATNKVSSTDSFLVRSYSELYLLEIKFEAFMKYYKPYDSVSFNSAPVYFRDLENQFIPDDRLLSYDLFIYKVLLSQYANAVFLKKYREKYGSNDNFKSIYPNDFMYQYAIEKFDFLRALTIPQKTKDFILVNALLTDNAIQRANLVEVCYEKVKDIGFNPLYRSLIEKKIIAINPKKIEEILKIMSFKDPNNDLKKIDEISKKVAYIDLWATWCGPCIKEFEHSKILHESYQSNPNLSFVYISIDTDFKKWQNFVTTKQAPEGIHLIVLENELENYLTKLTLSGIPRYMIINKQGKIINANAPRPSDPKIREILDELLKEK